MPRKPHVIATVAMVVVLVVSPMSAVALVNQPHSVDAPLSGPGIGSQNTADKAELSDTSSSSDGVPDDKRQPQVTVEQTDAPSGGAIGDYGTAPVKSGDRSSGSEVAVGRNPSRSDVSVTTPLGHSGAHHTTGPGAIMKAIDEGGVSNMFSKYDDRSASDHQMGDVEYSEPTQGSVCPGDAPVRHFNVTAIQVDIVYNKYGQHDPNGRMYVLEKNKQEVLQQVQNAPDATIANPNPNATVPLVQPLTLRAHLGDCVKISFDNGLNTSASMHPSGLPFNVEQSDGMAVGNNQRSFAKAGEEVNYTWYASNKGTHFFGDAVNIAEGTDPDRNTSDGSLRSHGMFGALVVEPKGTQWLDTETLEPIESGNRAIIKDPDGPDFREFVIFYHDGADIINGDGSEPTWPHTNVSQSLYTMNYRGDPMGARLREQCPDCDVPENFYSSWVHGDPGGGDLVYNAYVGDPLKMRIVGSQTEESHVHHQHGHRWKSTPGDPNSNTIDSQTVSPGASYEAIYNAGFGDTSVRPDTNLTEAQELGGAGYVQGSPGDYIFHCHLFPHYASGMWAILRVNDKKRENLASLPDKEPPPEPTAGDPGYWNPNGPGPKSFVNGTIGEEPKNPPDPQLRPPTALEESAINGSGISDPIVPGAPYADPCPGDAPIRQYNITVFQTNITYNDAGDFDDTAWMYALKKNVDAIQNGSMRPRPLAIRANVGECVTINLTNQLPEDVEPNRISMHIHFVGFDTLGSDGLTLGYNYDEGVEPGEKIRYRWYADEQGTIFWHDHLSGIEKGMHGLFGSLIVEPKNSTWLNPYTGDPLEDGDGTRAIIDMPNSSNTSDFREQMLWYQDFARLHDGDTGEPLNGPHNRTLDDQGVMAINYANAPMYRRDDKKGPAYTFSSWIHGDPQTPIIEAYKGDPVRIRLLQGTFEEQHNFQIHGMDWKKEWNDKDAPIGTSQTVGTSEQFEFHLQPSPDSDFPVRDYLYGSFTQADMWNGMWGLFRVWSQKSWHLAPLPDRGYPNSTYTSLESQDSLSTDATSDDGEVTQNDTEDQADKDEGEPLRVTRPKNDTSSSLDDGDKSKSGDSTESGDSTTSWYSSWPPKAPSPGDPCPGDATTRTYNVTAFHHNITYNDEGDHDPHGLVFALDSQVQAIQNDTVDEKPLVLRANKGDCIEVNLTNALDTNKNNDHAHAEVPVNQDWEYSHRISLHPKGVQYDVLGSDGATVGLNFDQTVGPGNSTTYRWFAANETGAQVIWDMADIRSHRHHGSFGMLIVEPENSRWLDPVTREPIRTGPRAIIDVPGDSNREDFREFALLWADGQYIVNPSGKCIIPPGDEIDPSEPCNQAAGDPEDQGFKGLNYRSEPFRWRFETNDSEAWVFSSKVHGDPSTPVMRAYRDDPVVFRVGMGADKRRGVSVQLSGHEFHQFWRDEESPVKGTYSLTPGGNLNIQPRYDAGGFQNQSGDYLVRAMKLRNYLEGGLWGIFRVKDDPGGIASLPDREMASPTGVTASAVDNSSVDVSWDGVGGATSYRLYRATQDGGPYTLVTETTTTGFTDTGLSGGTTYHYVVTAVDEDGNESPLSTESDATTD